MEMSLNYGKGSMSFELHDTQEYRIYMPKKAELYLPEEQILSCAIQNPIGTKRLSELVKKGDKVVIITSDITRPMPANKILPFVLDELHDSGVDNEDITIIFGLGCHRDHREEEIIRLVGENIYNSIKCIDSDPTNCVSLGITKRGTPVDIFKPVADADIRILLGNIEYHYFAGYSGGAKAVMPGVSSRAAIRANHSMMLMPGAKAGNLENNPVRDDIEEVLRYLPVDFIVNVVLDEYKNIVYASSGHCISAHRDGCTFLDRMYKAQIGEKADIVLVSAGGYPKDINLYQAQKALDNASLALKDGGVLILAAKCDEGLGDNMFKKWLLNAKRPDDLIERINKKFVLGGHKAAAIANIAKKSDIYLVSDIDTEIVDNIFMKPFDDISSALNEALRIKGKDADLIILPKGGSTLPY